MLLTDRLESLSGPEWLGWRVKIVTPTIGCLHLLLKCMVIWTQMISRETSPFTRVNHASLRCSDFDTTYINCARWSKGPMHSYCISQLTSGGFILHRIPKKKKMFQELICWRTVTKTTTTSCNSDVFSCYVLFMDASEYISIYTIW